MSQKKLDKVREGLAAGKVMGTLVPSLRDTNRPEVYGGDGKRYELAPVVDTATGEVTWFAQEWSA